MTNVESILGELMKMELELIKLKKAVEYTTHPEIRRELVKLSQHFSRSVDIIQFAYNYPKQES